MNPKGFVNHWSQPEENEPKQMASILGVTDESILRELQTLGFTSRTARLLWLLPGLQVAWADGYVSLREGEMLLRAACARAALSDLSAKAMMQRWLEQHPSETFFDQALHSIRGILHTINARDRALLKEDLLAHCHEIAAASRHLNGMHRRAMVSENAVINQIAATL
ncbi:MAG: hypothetical protein HOP19_19860 [Acidobacteria bacterium]|nr:hypothetical protein [Acidobacteriota bacterium]